MRSIAVVITRRPGRTCRFCTRPGVHRCRALSLRPLRWPARPLRARGFYNCHRRWCAPFASNRAYGPTTRFRGSCTTGPSMGQQAPGPDLAPSAASTPTTATHCTWTTPRRVPLSNMPGPCGDEDPGRNRRDIANMPVARLAAFTIADIDAPLQRSTQDEQDALGRSAGLGKHAPRTDMTPQSHASCSRASSLARLGVSGKRRPDSRRRRAAARSRP